VLLCVPRMDIQSPGEGVMAARAGTVTAVSATEIVVDGRSYPLRGPGGAARALAAATITTTPEAERMLVLPTMASWQEPAVVVGQRVAKKQLLARGTTHIYFQANVWIFTLLVFAVGIAMGIGKAGVYKLIPDYFPRDVGVVGGIVGVIGGLGGFVCPILFGTLLEGTGLWTTTWMFLAAVSIVCLVWLHLVVRRIVRDQAPTLARQLERHQDAPAAPAAVGVPAPVPVAAR
jgi:NNP family nitrate/nitrite transporter-like MFS transporter